MKRHVLFLLVFLIPAMAFSQENKSSKTKLKRMTVTKYVTEKSVEKAFPELDVRYDEKGNVVEEKEYDEGTFIMHFKYEYDAAGNKIKETEYDASGKIVKTTTYKYNNANQRIEKLVYDPRNNLKSKRIYKYESW